MATKQQTEPSLLTKTNALNAYNAFRILLAVFLNSLIFIGTEQIPQQFTDLTFSQFIIIGYGLAAIILLIYSRLNQRLPTLQGLIGLLCDIAAITLAIHNFETSHTGIGILLVFSVGASAILLGKRLSLLIASLATVAILFEYLFSTFYFGNTSHSATEAGLLGASYFITAILVSYLEQRIQTSQNLAQQRGIDLANMQQLNELIIKQMRTGIIVVDHNHQIRFYNEAGHQALDNPKIEQTNLAEVSPTLLEELSKWQQTGQSTINEINLVKGAAAVVPRFSTLGIADNQQATIIFLEDSGIVNRRAEEMALSSLGRLSASIAHEIRNPLGAISHAAQLLTESEQIDDTDQRLITIITNHCRRMNDLIKNVLGLSKRKHAKPEQINLNEFLKKFHQEFMETLAINNDNVVLVYKVEPQDMQIIMDPSHLSQVLNTFCDNAVTYGKNDQGMVNITIECLKHDKINTIKIIDSGPGIPTSIKPHVFEPFFTTGNTSSGLGLYIAHELCTANQVKLSYQEPIQNKHGYFELQLTQQRWIA